MNNEGKRLLSSQEAAKRLGVARSTILRWIEKGELAAYRVGPRGLAKIPEEEIERYLQSRWRRPKGQTDLKLLEVER